MSKNTQLNVEKILEKFREDEDSSSKRKGKFRIESSTEEALKKILKAKPEPKRKKKRREINDASE